MSSDEFPVYGDRPRGPVPPAVPGARREPPPCPACGSLDHEEGFVEGTSDSLVRYYAAEREVSFFGVKRFGVERRPVLARRCLRCSRLDLFAPDPD